MKRFLIYFSPIIILFLLLLMTFMDVFPVYYTHEIFLFSIPFFAIFLLSLYWAVGFWVPGERLLTLISIVCGFGVLVLAGVLCKKYNGIYLAAFVPVVLMALALIRRH